MNNYWNIILTIIGTVAGVGVLAGGVGFFIQSYKKSGRQERQDVTNTADAIVDFWKKQAEELKVILQTKDAEFNTKVLQITKEFNEKIQALTQQVGELTGQLNAEKNQNERLEKIFQNRDPQMQEFMKLLTNAAISSQKFMEESRLKEDQKMEMWNKIVSVLDDIHAMSASNHDILDSRKKDVKIEGKIVNK